jgi:hypothetical protein
MNNQIKCLCINDSARPETIPTSKWVKKGEVYHIKHIYNQFLQGGVLAFVLWEIDLKGCDPYNCFLASRFAFKEQDLGKLSEMIKACGELNDFDINKMLEVVETRELIEQD